MNKYQADVTNAIDTGIAALGHQTNFRAVNSVMDNANGWLGQLDTIDPKDETSVTNAITACYTAMTALRIDEGSKWTIPFAEGPV